MDDVWKKINKCNKNSTRCKSLNNVNFDGLRVINTSRNPSNGHEGPMRIIDGKVRFRSKMGFAWNLNS